MGNAKPAFEAENSAKRFCAGYRSASDAATARMFAEARTAQTPSLYAFIRTGAGTMGLIRATADSRAPETIIDDKTYVDRCLAVRRDAGRRVEREQT
jgi:hypothetical protein